MEALADAGRPRSPARHGGVLVSGALGFVGGGAAGIDAVVAAGWLPGPAALAGVVAGAALLGAAVLVGLEVASRPLLAAVAGPQAPRAAGWLLPLSALPALLPLLGAVGLQVPVTPTLLLLLLLRAGAILLAVPARRRDDLFSSLGWLSFLFLLSGFAALIYQIVWQRALFTAFGVNIESITVVVSLFMLGLGLGSFVGGMVSHRHPDRAPWLFLACEVGIGLFGTVSLPLVDAVSRATLFGPPWQVALAVFGLLCVPTTLMGATLPILVTHVDRRLRSVGKSVGLLYCINTVGSAIACFLTADVLFVVLGRQGSVLVAAGMNLLVGALVLRFARRVGRRGEPAPAAQDGDPPAPPTAAPPPAVAPPALEARATGALAHRGLVLFLAAATGYVSLSQEMVWMRVVGYMTGGSPAVFAHVLGFFLLGVAFGAFRAERLCDGRSGGLRAPLRYVARMLLVSGVFYYLSVAATAAVHDLGPPVGLALAHVVVAVVSFLLGGVFPVLCQYGARSGRTVGLAVSRLYVANIVGSTLGPLLTGFVLMERFSTADLVLGLSVGTLLLGAATSLADRGGPLRLPWAPVLASAALVLVNARLGEDLLPWLHHDRGRDFRPYHVLVENRHGVIATVAPADGGPDVIYGGGMYDGTMNTDPRDERNWIDRCYMIAAIHPGPRDVLEVGMSGASWTRVMADYAPIERLTVVEINPGYLDLVRTRGPTGRLLYPRQASVLDDPRVDVQIDDGRRWMNRHPERRFDLILQNTTHHWRSQITNLLSEEWLRTCKSRLKPGGVLYLNSTYCYSVPYTAARVFRHVLVVRNEVAASDAPFDLSPEQVRANLLRFRADGKPTFDPARPEDEALLDRLSNWFLLERADVYGTRRAQAEVGGAADGAQPDRPEDLGPAYEVSRARHAAEYRRAAEGDPSAFAAWLAEHEPGVTVGGTSRGAWDQADLFRDRRDVLPRFPVPAVVLPITDDDMATEFKLTPLLARAPTWSAHASRLRSSWARPGRVAP